jgi:KDO2-lipid IV(A) lauroyltransferase
MAELSYSYRPSALSAERHYRLEHDALAWTYAGRTGRVSYGDIEQVQAFKVRYFGASKTYWSCVLFPRSGGRIRLSAASRAGFRTIEDRSAAYIPFIKELEARVAAANPAVRRTGGRRWLAVVDELGGRIAVALIRMTRRFSVERSGAAAGWAMRRIGPWLRGHRTARAQLVSAFPEKTAAEIDRILAGMWDNIGRVAAEYAHLDRLWRYDPADPARSRIIMDPQNDARWRQFQREKHAALMFAAHLANWELPPHAATAAGRQIALVYRAPSIGSITDELTRIRSRCVAALIPAGRSTPLRIKSVLRDGWMLGMLVDQHYGPGVDVTFFNQPCKVNSLLARLARLFDCPIHGSRVIRLPDGRFRFEVTEALSLPRDKEGKIDVAATMQMVTSIIENWVREYPEQWTWMHRRWR